jgi:xyloglucan-specific exo-beta-1,4-glucanase
VGILVSPPKGAHLLSGVGDICGFRHDDLDKASITGFYSNPTCNGTTGLDYAELQPDLFVRVGRVWGDEKHHGAYSLTGGATWKPFEFEPIVGPDTGGLIAVTADGKSWIWAMKAAKVVYSKDRGKTWPVSQGAPDAQRVADWANYNLQLGLIV